MQQVEQAKDELIKVITADRDAWKLRYETEREEYITYRKAAHDHNNEVNARMLKLTTENGELRSKTDISPLLEHQEEQTKINMQVVKTLSEMMQTLTKMTTTLDMLTRHLQPGSWGPTHHLEAPHG